MQNTMIRTNNSDLLNSAKKALIAQKAQKAQKRQERAIRTFFTNWTNLYVPAIPANQDILAEMHQIVQKAQKNHDAAIRTLAREMDKTDESPIAVYTTLKGTFGANLPSFQKWFKTA
jgi:hypothetical protein